jgi:hypothetical protein
MSEPLDNMKICQCQFLYMRISKFRTHESAAQVIDDMLLELIMFDNTGIPIEDEHLQ